MSQVAADRGLARDVLLPGVLVAAFAIALGIGAWWSLPIWGEDDPHRFYGHGIFYFLFARDEPIALVLSVGAIALLWWLARGDRWTAVGRLLDAPPRTLAALLAGSVFAVCLIGTYTVTQDYPLALDEFLPRFQAEIFRAGALRGDVPEAWRSLTAALSPILLAYDASRGIWMVVYFPTYSLLLMLIGPLAPALMPAFAAGAVALAGGCAQALWGERRTTNAAMLLLATSPQLLINAMTGYPLAGQLFLNLLWLRLLLSERTAAALLLAPLSAFTLLFHQPLPHFLFVVPLAAVLIFQRRHRPALFAWHAVWAGLALWGFRAWQGVAGDVTPSSGTSLFGVPDAWAVLTHSMNVSLLVTWPGLGLALLAPLALRRVEGGDRRARAILIALAAGFGACLFFYLFFNSHQGHGWGYRYAFPLIGNLVLLATAGFRALAQSRGPRAGVVVATAALIGVALLLPLRGLQVATFIAPYANADRAIAASDASLVLIDGGRSWYGGDLVRNDPFLRNSPKRGYLEAVRPNALPAVAGKTLVLSARELRARFGLLTRKEAGDFTLRRAGAAVEATP